MGLVLVPVAVFGAGKTLALYQQYTEVLIRPALGTGTDASRAHELTNVVATDSQSLQAILHNTLNRDLATRPRQPAAWILAVNYLLGGVLTLLTLWPARRKNANIVLALGALILVMLFISPVCHLHYYVFALPLVMGFLAQDFQRHNRVGRGLILLLSLNMITWLVPNLPGLEVWREIGLATYGALLIWLVAVLRLWKGNSSWGWRRDPHFWPRSTQFPLVNEGRRRAGNVSDRKKVMVSPVAQAPDSAAIQ